MKDKTIEIAKELSKININYNENVNANLAEGLANDVIKNWTDELVHSNCIENDDSSNGLKYYIKQAILDGIEQSQKNK